MSTHELLQSPLNYTGGKFKLLPQILPLFPRRINTFVDLFCGGGNVGINVDCKKILFNDINDKVISLLETFKDVGKDEIFSWIDEIISAYDLSDVSANGYKHYDCDSEKGLGKYNKEKYLKLREDFNKSNTVDYLHYIKLYVLIIYAFNNQIRFNSNDEFNLPVGKRDFNKRMQIKLEKFIDRIKQRDCSFSKVDFEETDITGLSSKDFVYADPPYLIGCASYNEQGGWNEEKERSLLSFLDTLHKKGIKFALSNVLTHKGKENEILREWLRKHKAYTCHHLNCSYSNSNYHSKNKHLTCDEVLITNYKKKRQSNGKNRV